MIRTISAADRHSGDFGWLKTLWLFSFGDYYDPENLEFGTLRVFNDDVVAPSTGFGKHGHRDMEIVTVMLAGAITHQDSIGTNAVISAGEVQRMSAGSGVMHSEYNRGTVPAHFYQVWFPPRTPGGKPSYEQASFTAKRQRNQLVHLVSGFAHPGALAINSDAAMATAELDAGSSLEVGLAAGRGMFIYVISGALTVNGTALSAGDQARITAERTLSLTATATASIIAVEVAGV